MICVRLLKNLFLVRKSIRLRPIVSIMKFPILMLVLRLPELLLLNLVLLLVILMLVQKLKICCAIIVLKFPGLKQI